MITNVIKIDLFILFLQNYYLQIIQGTRRCMILLIGLSSVSGMCGYLLFYGGYPPQEIFAVFLQYTI